jgi:hypothetical protein
MEPYQIPTQPASKRTPPEKYIRTFASDMDIFQKGGTPGLAPLKQPHPTSEEHFVATMPIPSPIELPALEPKPIPEPELEPTPEEVLFPVADLGSPPESISRLEPIPKFDPEPIPLVVEEKPTPLETYALDFSERVKNTQASAVSILAAEQDAARPIQTLPDSPVQMSRNRLYIVASVLLLLVGGVGVAITYSQYQIKIAPVFIAPVVVAPIAFDASEKVSGTGTVLMQSIKQSVGMPLSPNTVRLLTFDTASSTSVFSALARTAPSILLRNIPANGSMAGVVNTGGRQSPFFILSVSAYDSTFSGMLSWEPSMPSDLGVLFPAYPSVAVEPMATTTATSTKSIRATNTATTTMPVPALGSFRDEVVSNHDVRVYRDAQGRSVLLYGYWNQTLLVIARDSAAFALILARLATSRS